MLADFFWIETMLPMNDTTGFSGAAQHAHYVLSQSDGKNDDRHLPSVAEPHKNMKRTCTRRSQKESSFWNLEHFSYGWKVEITTRSGLPQPTQRGARGEAHCYNKMLIRHLYLLVTSYTDHHNI